MRSIAPGSSGAMVMTRSPSMSGSSTSRGTEDGARSAVGSWAPRRTGGQERSLEIEPERLRAIRRRARPPVADAVGETPQVLERRADGRREERR